MVEVLDDLRGKQKLADRGMKFLKEGIEFLELVKRGKHYTKTLQLDERAMESCSAFGMALRALNHLYSVNETVEQVAHPNIDDFFDDINGMLIKITKDGSVSPERLDFLRAFFGAIRDIIIQENLRPPESVLIKQGLV